MSLPQTRHFGCTRRVFTAPVNVSLESGDRFELNWAPEYERVDAPFEIGGGVVIPPWKYRFDRFRAEVQSSDVVRTASGIPVLVRGGGRVGDEELLRRTAAVLEQGAAGVVYG